MAGAAKSEISCWRIYSLGATDGLAKLSCNPFCQTNAISTSERRAIATFQTEEALFISDPEKRRSEEKDYAYSNNTSSTKSLHVVEQQFFPKVTLRLLLVRHGLSSFNREGRIQGRTDLSFLTDEGIEQAIETGKALAKVPIDAVFSSPLKRAKETTLKILSENKQSLKPIFDEDLLEIELGHWSGLTAEEVKKKSEETYNLWKDEPENLRISIEGNDQFEPLQELSKQAKRFINKLTKEYCKEEEKTVLVVAHNAIIRCIILELTGGLKDRFKKIKLSNASISIINIQPNTTKDYQSQIECLNNISHLTKCLPEKVGMGRIILVRHGETDWNLAGRFQGQIDIPLNKNGQSQAKAAGIFLSKFHIDHAFSSSMTRPRETAEAILSFHPDVKIELKDDLKEIAHGLWEGKLESEIEENWPDLLAKWKNRPEEVEMPQGESIEQVSIRSVRCWESICSNMSSGESILIVAHDAVNKTILCHLLGLKPKDIWSIKQGNGGISIIDIPINKKESSIVTCLNLTSHLGGIIDSTAAGAL